MKINNFALLNKTIKPKFLAILLHGYGSNGNDIINLADKIFHPIINECVCIAPNSPIQCTMPHTPKNSLQWFDLYTNTEKIFNSMAIAVNLLNIFIDQQLKKFSIADENLFIFGFSQGGMLTIDTALQRVKPCCSALCFSSALLFPEKLAESIKSKSNFCLLHGEDDDIVPSYATHNISQKFSEYNIKHEVHFLPNLGHHINNDGINLMSKYILNIST